MPPRVAAFARECLEPVESVLDPTRRLYWPHLLSAAVLAALVWWLHVRRAGRTSLWAFLTSRNVWLHPSALLDYRFLFLRAVLGALVLWPSVLSAQALAGWLSLRLVGWFGPGPGDSVERAVVIAVFSVSSFVLRDFLRFLAHYASHRIPALWEIHKVHHSAEVLTPFTLNRTHPIEGALMRGASLLALGLAAGICSWLFRGRIEAWEILGVDALSFVWTLAGSNLRHSHVWLSFGPRWERWFLSPAQHQVHHSVAREHHDKNLGEVFALWDWVFGTLYVTHRREPLKFGLDASEVRHRQTVWSLLWSPFVAACRRLVPTSGRD